MTVKELINNELNKIDSSEINLHLIMETYLKNNKKIYNLKHQLDHQATFDNNSVIIALKQWCKENNILETYQSSRNKLLESFFYATSSPDYNTFDIKVKGINLSIYMRYLEKDKIIHQQISESNNDYMRIVSLGKTFKSCIVASLTEDIKFNFEMQSNIKDNYETSIGYRPSIYFDPDTYVDKNTLLDKSHKIFKLIPHAIAKSTSLKDFFEVLDMQYDFNYKIFENTLISYFEKNKNLEKHGDLLFKLANGLQNNNKKQKINR